MSKDSSSSEDSGDEDLAKLQSAIDPDFKVLVTKKGVENGAEKKPKKSNRKELNAENDGWDSGHFVHPLKLTPHSQNFISKQLSEAIEKQIKVTKKKKIVQHSDDDYGIFLLRKSTERLSKKDLNDWKEHLKQQQEKQKRPVIKKRKVELEENDCSSSDEDSRLKSVAVNADWVLNKSTL